MKQCPNPNCMIYNVLEGLPDAYVQCPLCHEALVEATPAMGISPPAYPPDDQATSIYAPVAVAQPRHVQQRLNVRDSYADYDESESQAESQYDEADAASDVEPPEPAYARALARAKGCTVAAAVFALLAACVLMVVIVGSRLIPQSSGSGTSLVMPGTQGPGIKDQGSGIREEASRTTEPTPDPRSLIPIKDALMCAKLEAGQPIGPTHAYHPTDPFNLAVQAAYGQGGVMTALTRWYGPDGAPIYDLKQNYSQRGTYYAGFTLTKAAPWAIGDYHVEIYTNSSTQPVQTVSFSVINP